MVGNALAFVESSDGIVTLFNTTEPERCDESIADGFYAFIFFNLKSMHGLEDKIDQDCTTSGPHAHSSAPAAKCTPRTAIQLINLW
jgi:hypothetical protein